MKFAICGSRKIKLFADDVLALIHIVNTFTNAQVKDWEFVSGGAEGIDTAARNFATKYRYKFTEFKPEYDKFPGNVAPLKRNETIAEYSDVLLVIHNGSNGSKHVIREFEKRGKLVFQLAVPKTIEQKV